MKKFEAEKQRIQAEQRELGQEIDSDILDFVTVLNCLGFETVSSCAGHPEEGLTSFPSVTIMTKKQEKDKIKDCHKRNLLMQQQMMDLLQSFYVARNVEYKHMLIMEVISGLGFVIRPHSGYLTKIVEDVKKRNALHSIYIEEVNSFTKFLKNTL